MPHNVCFMSLIWFQYTQSLNRDEVKIAQECHEPYVALQQCLDHVEIIQKFEVLA